jgi:hypothetical protein
VRLFLFPKGTMMNPTRTSSDTLHEAPESPPQIDPLPEPKHAGARIAAEEGIPDAHWINNQLPIADVAVALGCGQPLHGKLHCWHPERHKNGDRTPSVGIKKAANRVKCFGCAGDSKYMSVIDFAKDYLGVDVRQAIRWLAERFEIPRISRGKHLDEPDRPRFAVGNEDPVELLVRSGVWAILSPPAQRIFPVLLSFAQRDDKRRYMIEMSYLGMQRYSGLKSPNAVKGALACLGDFHLLEAIPVLWEHATPPATGQILPDALRGRVSRTGERGRLGAPGCNRGRARISQAGSLGEVQKKKTEKGVKAVAY